MADDRVVFGRPSPLKSTLATSQEHSLVRLSQPLKPRPPQNPSIFIQRKPFRAGHAPHDTSAHVKPSQGPSPSSYPTIESFVPGRSVSGPLPSFKKKPSAVPKSTATPIIVRRVEETLSDRERGHVPQQVKKERPPMFQLSSRDMVLHEEPSNPAKSAQELRAFLDGAFSIAQVAAKEEDSHVEGLRCSLLPHQIDGVAFLKQREMKAAGGLLADDMGLGKTVQTVALILSNRKQEEQCIRSTLVVAPLSLIEQWAGEIRSKTNMTVYVHHGPTRKRPNAFSSYDVILTTYQILVSEHASPNPEFEIDNDRGVFGVTWYRIVLDEAHTIKNRHAKTSHAACALRAIKRWCLTGTPLQNTVEDLFSILKFLQIPPLNDYPQFKEKISGPVARGKTKLAMQRLGVVLSQMMLRRTKAVLKNGFALPPRLVQHVQVDFSPSERTFYTGLENRAQETLQRMKKEGEEIGYMSVLVLLQRLRQACNHAQLVTKELDVSDYRVATKADSSVDALADLFSGVGMQSRQCAICLAVCSSEHCNACADAIQGNLSLSCKLAKMMQLLELHKGKAILFSQWTSMLDLCAPFLEAKGIKFVKYYGSMPNKLREASLATLKQDPECRVLLCSLKAGALGLNLTVANLVFLLDVWWNPAIEEQAIDRVHRIGQIQEVKVFKLTVRDTVEDRIIALQDKKREMAKSALGEGGKMARLGMDELLALFNTRE